ncbi:hypothetical protein PM082_020805 [Marasmius tenuissimus]|nr:hypothetical protein PM082_020805 [Marasmius tenuissimus]
MTSFSVLDKFVNSCFLVLWEITVLIADYLFTPVLASCSFALSTTIHVSPSFVPASVRSVRRFESLTATFSFCFGGKDYTHHFGFTTFVADGHFAICSKFIEVFFLIVGGHLSNQILL